MSQERAEKANPSVARLYTEPCGPNGFRHSSQIELSVARRDGLHRPPCDRQYTEMSEFKTTAGNSTSADYDKQEASNTHLAVELDGHSHEVRVLLNHLLHSRLEHEPAGKRRTQVHQGRVPT